jgi:hypothetical protein
MSAAQYYLSNTPGGIDCMHLYRIYDRPCGSLVCTVAGDDIKTPAEALAKAKTRPFVAQELTDEACAFPCEEVGEW